MARKSNLDMRLVYENALAFAQRENINLQNAICSQGYIRSEVAMGGGTQFNLPILVNQQQQNGLNARILSNPLQLQDIFFVSEVLIGWTVATSTAVNGKIYTYPSEAAAVAAGATAADIQTLYNGKFSLQINNRNVVPSWDLNRHLMAPQTQENTNFNVTNANLNAPSVRSSDEVDLSEDAFYPVEPGWILNGAANINAQISLPSAIATVPTNGAIVAIFRGIVIQNSTTVR